MMTKPKWARPDTLSSDLKIGDHIQLWDTSEWVRVTGVGTWVIDANVGAWLVVIATSDGQTLSVDPQRLWATRVPKNHLVQ